MAIHPDLVHNVIGDINGAIDPSNGGFDRRVSDLVNVALDRIPKGVELTWHNKLECLALSDKISSLHQGRITNCFFKVIGKRTKESLVQDLLFKAHLQGDVEKVTPILNAIKEIPEEERSAVFEAASYWIKEGMSGDCIACILNVVKKIPEEERGSVFEAAAYLLPPGTDLKEGMYVLKDVSLIPKEQRVLVCQAVGPLIEGPMGGYQMFHVLKIVQRASEEELSDGCHGLVNLIPRTHANFVL